MKNRSTKKGFTLVELVIVIAVIAILSAVLIPTFSNVIENANKSAAEQEANNLYKAWLADNLTKDSVDATGNICIKYKNYYFHVTNGKFENVTEGHSDTGTPLVLEVNTDGKLQIQQ